MMQTGEQRYSFELDGDTYSGHIISSTTIEPHFHWFMFEDHTVISKYGDSIAFKVKDGELLPLYHLTAPGLVAAVKNCVQQYLAELQQQGN
jgi:hypothetical protein